MIINQFQWIASGSEAFRLMLQAMEEARESLRLETYILTDSPLARKFRAAAVAAAQRGVKVQIMLDAFGSYSLSSSYWTPFVQAGGEFRWFNPLSLKRLTFRNHRKLLVTDGTTAYVGGFNISPEYDGDGVAKGWRDLGIRVEGPLARDLAKSFDALFERADLQHPLFTRLRRSGSHAAFDGPDAMLLLSGPGRGRNAFKRALLRDLASARHVRIVAAYFLPTGRLRRAIQRVVRRGGHVQIVLPSKSDVGISLQATQGLYQRLLRDGIEIYEYQPQILHSKLVMVDDVCYVGSSNLDARSLHINYELMLRISQAEPVVEARKCFEDHLRHSRQVLPNEWRQTRSLFGKLRERWAAFVLTRIDPLLMRWQLRELKQSQLENQPPRRLPVPRSPSLNG